MKTLYSPKEPDKTRHAEKIEWIRQALIVLGIMVGTIAGCILIRWLFMAR